MSDHARPLFDLARVADALGRALSPGDDDLVSCIAATARAVFGAAACSMALITPDGTEVVFTTASGGAGDDISGLRMPIGKGIVGWVASTGQSVAVGDLANDPRFSSDIATRTGYLPSSILACPIETQDLLLGVIEILDRDATRPGAEQDLQLLALFARQAGLAIDAALRNDRIGAAMLTAFAADDDLSDVLESLPTASFDGDDDLGRIAAAFSRLASTGPAERALAVSVLEEVGRYAARRG